MTKDWYTGMNAVVPDKFLVELSGEELKLLILGLDDLIGDLGYVDSVALQDMAAVRMTTCEGLKKRLTEL